MPGVPEWDKKLVIIKLLYNVQGDKELCDKVKPDTTRVDFYDNIRKWRDNKPRSRDTRSFFDNIARHLGCTNMNGQKLISCSYDEFFKSLPNQTKQFLMNQEYEAVDHIIYRSHVHDFSNKEDEWLRTGYVDQKYMYLNHDAVENWRNVVDDKEYKTYSHCLVSLNDFVDHPLWEKRVREKPIRTIVILGVGSPEKDLVVISSVLKKCTIYTERNPLRIVLVDSSFYMLDDTYTEIFRSLERRELARSIDIILCCGDFTRLKPQSTRIRPAPHPERVAFFILGGTIGNIDEGRFIASVHQVSEPGDLLIVSAEFVNEADPEAYKSELVKNYSSDTARDLVLEPVRKLLDRKGVSTERSERRKIVVPRLRENDGFFSPIEGTIAVELHAEAWGIDLALSISNRLLKLVAVRAGS